MRTTGQEPGRPGQERGCDREHADGAEQAADLPDKRSLFFAAVLASHQPVLDWMDGLPARAGAAPLADTLTDCLLHLSELRAAVVPLELALASDPDLTKDRARALDLATVEAQGGPPHLLAQYLRAEQNLGRVRTDIDTTQAAVALLAALFGLSAGPLTPAGPLNRDLIAGAVNLILDGITPITNPPADHAPLRATRRTRIHG